MEGERNKDDQNVRDEIFERRVMDEILVREPATGKLRSLVFLVWSLLISSWSDLAFFFWHRRRG